MRVAVTILVFCVAALLALGMVMLYSSGVGQGGARYLTAQLTWCVVGVASCITVACLDYRLLKKFVWPIFILGIVLLVLVFVKPVGIHRNGATRWLGYHKTSLFQPSEFSKLALIIAIAWYAERFQRRMPTFKRGILLPGLLAAPIIGLIFIEPDVGNALLLSMVSAILLLIAGIRWRFFLPPALIGVAAVTVFLCHNQMRSERIYSWLHLEETKLDKGMQAYQAMLALGSGGWTGLGLGNGRQKLGFVPFHYTDFILSVIGEELGLTATLLVIAAFIAIVICGIYIATRSRDTFGMLLGCGIVFLIGLQAFINVGVVTSVLPNKGLPLPFISQGGSNLVVLLTSVGLLLSIARLAATTESAVGKMGDDEEQGSIFGSRRNPFRPSPP
jgi:cell division protein FtsW